MERWERGSQAQPGTSAALRRYHVPDLTPRDRPQLKSLKPKQVFIAESPHINEVESEDGEQRRPLCGPAGRAWWTMLGELLEGNGDIDLSRDRLIRFCKDHEIAIMNAVQEPLDPKIVFKFPSADPVRNLGFAKTTGEFGYKKKKNSPELQRALTALRERLKHPALKDAAIYVLGLDSEWFVAQALGKEEFARRVKARLPHPSAWWRQGGLFERIAHEKLTSIFDRK